MRKLLASAALAGVAILGLPGAAQADEIWRAVPLPFLWPSNDLRDIDAAAADSVWIAGYQGGFCIGITYCRFSSPGNPVVRRWDGSGWREYPLNGWSGQGEMRSVEAENGEVWVNGGASDDPFGYLARFNGGAFTPVTPPAVGARLVDAGPAGVWTAASGALYRWNGSGWTAAPTPPGFGTISVLSSRTATDGWVMDSAGGFAHWNGTAWESRPSAPLSQSILSIRSVAADDVWAVSMQAIAHWDGSSWTSAPPPTGLQIRDLAVGPDNVPAVSTQLSISGGDGLFRYNDQAWNRVPISVADRVHKLASVPGTSTLWATASTSRGGTVITNG